jgi:hypothetical protein
LLLVVGPATAGLSAVPQPITSSGSDFLPNRLNVYDIRGHVVATLPGPATLAKPQAMVVSRSPITSLSVDGAGLPAGIYFVRPAIPAADRSAPTHVGALSFEDVTPRFLPHRQWNPEDIDARDVTGDGLLDIVFSLYRASCDSLSTYPFRVWVQTPAATFVDETESRVPLFRGMGYDLDLFDAEGDGDLDVFLSGIGCGDPGDAAALFINDGAGHFSNETGDRLPQFDDDRFVYFAAEGRLDRDPFPDLVVNIFPTSTGFTQPELWLNDGTGHFSRAPGRLPPPGKYGYFNVSVADFTGEGNDDIIFADLFGVFTDYFGTPQDSVSGQTAFYRNVGFGFFVDETDRRMPEGFHRSQFWIQTADVDGDGDLDILEVGFLWGENSPQLRLLLNNGTGRFLVATQSGLDSAIGWFNRPRFGLLDDDGAPDLFLPRVDPDAGGIASDLLYVNNGAGMFGDFSSALPNVVDFSVGCALFDHERDGDMDIVTANGGGPNATDEGQNVLYHNLTHTLSVSQDRPASEIRLGPVTPNPATERMALHFSLPREANVRLSVLDVGGRLLRDLALGRFPAGDHRASWDLRDVGGSRVSAGLYFCRLNIEGSSHTRRFAVAR